MILLYVRKKIVFCMRMLEFNLFIVEFKINLIIYNMSLIFNFVIIFLLNFFFGKFFLYLYKD